MFNEIDDCICESWEEALDLSTSYCMGGLPDSYNCQWYHGSWCLLRCLGLVSNPFWHQEFYAKALCDHNPSSVCVVGTAGISMPFFVSNFYKGKLVIVDMCKTPLKIGERFSQKKGLEWSFINRDVNSMIDHEGSFDFVINDAFLTRFKREERCQVVKSLSKLLKTGGHYVTTIRKSAYFDQGYRSDQKKREDFVNRAESKAKKLFPEHAELVKGMAETYINSMLSYPFEDMNEVNSIFINSGLKITTLSEEEVIGESEKSIYFRVVAEKV